MKAMVFAAGLGTRLRPLTDGMPKALVPLHDVPMLERVIKNIIACGITDVVVNIHHFGDQIIDFLAKNNNFGINIAISDERDMLLDTGGGILRAKPLLEGDEPFLVHNADIFTDLDLKSIINHHNTSGADATLLVKQRTTQRYLVFNKEWRMQGWTNIATGEVKPASLNIDATHRLMAFGGIHVISPSVFAALQNFANEPKFSITPFYIANCNNLNIQGFCPEGYNWFDIGKIETLRQAEQFIENR
ncbi:MAG: NDP-sugar synthase [Muribaculaceae bacterium]